MSLTQAIRSILIGNAGLLASVGSLPDGTPKFFPDSSPQTTSLPFVLIDEDNLVPEYGKNTDSRGNLDSIEILISVHDKSKKNALALAWQIRLILDGFTGIIDNTNIRSCGLERQDTGYVSEKEIFFVEQSYIVWVNNN